MLEGEYVELGGPDHSVLVEGPADVGYNWPRAGHIRIDQCRLELCGDCRR
jgi:hypothetical protein